MGGRGTDRLHGLFGRLAEVAVSHVRFRMPPYPRRRSPRYKARLSLTSCKSCQPDGPAATHSQTYQDAQSMPRTNSKVHAFKLDQKGLARVFGELEAEVMEAVWRLKEPTVADVCQELGDGANYKTVMTVMNRLVDKRVLTRRRESRAYRYAAVDDRSVFLERVSRRVVEGLLQDFGALAVASFVDAVDAVDPELLSKLEALIRARSDDEASTEARPPEADIIEDDLV